MRNTFLAMPLARKAASIACLFSLLMALVLILASHQGQRHLISKSSELFGESLVQQLSRDASGPLVQGDKLSLQALLHELVKSPLVVRGAIYDVENHPIAEAGNPGDGQDISASITFQDSIAGYAVVTFDTHQLQQLAGRQRWELIVLALLLAALIYVLALYPGRQLSAIINDLTLIAATPLKRRRANTQVAWHGEDELRELSRAVMAGPIEEVEAEDGEEFAVLVFEITNLPSLQVNLGQQALAYALQSLYQQLKTVCMIYDGELEASRSHCFTARFSARDDSNGYPFRALCSAFLIEQCLTDEDLPFHFRQAVTINQSALAKLEPVTGKQIIVEQGLLLATMVEDGIVLSEPAFHHVSVESRVLSTPLGDGAIRADRLHQTYRHLLERQIQSLRQH